jgi:hypothetical protein
MRRIGDGRSVRTVASLISHDALAVQEDLGRAGRRAYLDGCMYSLIMARRNLI